MHINPKYGAITRISGKDIDLDATILDSGRDVSVEVRVYENTDNLEIKWITDWVPLDNVHSASVHIDADVLFVTASLEVCPSGINNITAKIDDFIITPEPKKIR